VKKSKIRLVMPYKIKQRLYKYAYENDMTITAVINDTVNRNLCRSKEGWERWPDNKNRGRELYAMNNNQVEVMMWSDTRERLRKEAVRRGFSTSWLVVAWMMPVLGVTQAQLNEDRGYELPPLKDRKEGWFKDTKHNEIERSE